MAALAIILSIDNIIFISILIAEGFGVHAQGLNLLRKSINDAGGA